MPCPFLTRLPTAFVRNYGTALVKKYGEQCPVMSRALSTVAATERKKEQCKFRINTV